MKIRLHDHSESQNDISRLSFIQNSNKPIAFGQSSNFFLTPLTDRRSFSAFSFRKISARFIHGSRTTRVGTSTISTEQP